jgi:hypothetical protein
MLSGDGGDSLGCLHALPIPCSFLLFQDVGEEGGVTKTNAVGDSVAAFRPEFLLVVTLEAQHGLGNVLPQERRVAPVEQVEAAVNAIVFPKGGLDLAVRALAAQLADEGALRRLLSGLPGHGISA